MEQNFNFQIADFLAIGREKSVWILSYQMLVFGLFLKLAGLVALGSLHHKTEARTILFPGIAIGVSALFVRAERRLLHAYGVLGGAGAAERG